MAEILCSFDVEAFNAWIEEEKYLIEILLSDHSFGPKDPKFQDNARTALGFLEQIEAEMARDLPRIDVVIEKAAMFGMVMETAGSNQWKTWKASERGKKHRALSAEQEKLARDICQELHSGNKSPTAACREASALLLRDHGIPIGWQALYRNFFKA